MRKIFILLTVLCYGLMAMAMPARPGWHTIKQSDGTTLRANALLPRQPLSQPSAVTL